MACTTGQAAEQLQQAERQLSQLRSALTNAEARLQRAAAENAELAAAAAAAAAAAVPQAAGPSQAARRPFRPPSALCAMSSVAWRSQWDMYATLCRAEVRAAAGAQQGTPARHAALQGRAHQVLPRLTEHA